MRLNNIHCTPNTSHRFDIWMLLPRLKISHYVEHFLFFFLFWRGGGWLTVQICSHKFTEMKIRQSDAVNFVTSVQHLLDYYIVLSTKMCFDSINGIRRQSETANTAGGDRK